MLLQAGDPAAALSALADVPDDRRRNYQSYWVVLAHGLAAAGDEAGAESARSRAVGLTEDPAVRAWLLQGERVEPLPGG